MKALIPLTLVAIALFLIVTAPSTDADGETVYFQEGYFEYQSTEDGIAEVIDYLENLGPEDGNVVIPSSVTHEGKEYKVTAILAYLDEPEIITLRISSTVESLSVGSLMMDNLTQFYVDEGNTHYTAIDGVLFDITGQELLKFPCGREQGTYQVPSSTSIISADSFYKCKLKLVLLNKMLIKIGSQAFYLSPNLEEVKLDPSDPRETPLLTIIGDGAFNSCPRLSKIELPDSLEFLGSRALYSTAIEEIILPERLSHIGDAAFAMCENLKKIDSNNDRFTVEYGVLYSVDKELLCYPAKLEGDTFVVPQDIRSIAPYSFTRCSYLKSIVLNSVISIIEDDTFAWCTSLERITMPDVMMVGNWAFEKCSNLKEVVFGDNIYSIGMYAFDSTGLTEFNVPDSVVSLGSWCFCDCVNLKTVSFSENSRAALSDRVFYGCTGLEKITLNSTDLKLYNWCLSVGTDLEPATVVVEVVKGYSLPSKVADEYTTLVVKNIGDHPYPYENLIAVAFCVLVLIGILALVREV